jgi:hypothetical protein
VARQWRRFLTGQFSSRGYPGDLLYPEGGDQTGNRTMSGKQGLLCGTEAETSSEHGGPGVTIRHPVFTYSLPGRTTTQYLIVLDQSAQMVDRWGHTRRSLHQVRRQ